MKQFLFVWTVLGLLACYLYVWDDLMPLERVIGTVISSPFVASLGALLFSCVTGIFQKLRKVHP
jgi:hypothetical protein